MTDALSTPNPDLIAERAWALIEMRRWKEAVAEAQRALLLNPRHFSGLYNLTVAQRRCGDAVAAEHTARTLVGYYPNAASAYNMLSRALKDQRRYLDALAASREAVRLSPDEADLWINLSDVLMAAKLFNEGLEACEIAISLNPNLPMAHNNYAVGLEEFHRDDEAEAEYAKALALDPLNALFHSNLGWLQYKRKAYRAAADYFHAALMLEPARGEYRRSLESALRKAYPISTGFKLAHRLVFVWPMGLLAVLMALDVGQVMWPLFGPVYGIALLYAILIAPRVEAKLQTRYVQRKLNEILA